ncbi:MAG: amidohydrolase family protein [Chitinophagales bacterium]|jgi:hypothetical protein
MRFLLFLLLLVSFNVSAQKNYEFRNGNWYNGKDFTPGTWYSTGGKLTKKAPSKIDSVIDLTNKWVVPPMGDAFGTCLTANPTPDMQLRSYHNEGVFYVQILGNTNLQRTEIAPKGNQPTSPDISFANGEITCTLGEPFFKYEPAAMDIKNPNLIAQKQEEIKNSRKGLGDGYWFIDNTSAVSANWEKIKAQKPGVISIWLLDAEKNGGKPSFGLSPEVAKAIIKKAHKADLKVFAHVANAADLRLAITLGVDGIANLPGMQWDGTGDTKAYDLTENDIKLLVKKQTAIVPLLTKAQNTGTLHSSLRDYHKKTLKRLLDAGANVLVGSDDPIRTIRSEVNYWFALGDIPADAVLKSLCERTPRAIFPNRKIGKIEPKYEASFLVLEDNPLNNLLKIRAVDFKVKNGVLLPK